VAALVRLLAPLGITAPAVRTAVSRMVRQGWLDAVRVPGGAGYELTPRAVRRLDEAALGYLRYAPIDDTAWISPRPSRELEALLETERVRAERFAASYDGDARGLVARAWDLDGLSHAYQGWLAVAAALVAPAGPDAPDEVVFAARSRLVHASRFVDCCLRPAREQDDAGDR
jgi:phenylacetic acid degradation operon negative regulatory protein